MYQFTSSTIYLTAFNKVYVIDGSVNSLTQDSIKGNVTIGTNNYLSSIAVNPTSGEIDVADPKSNTVDVINGTATSSHGNPVFHVLTKIPVSASPQSIAVDSNSSMIYVANFLSNTISVIDGSKNKVVAGVTFNLIKPANSTSLLDCNGEKISRSGYLRFIIGTQLKCSSVTDSKVSFSSWDGTTLTNSSSTNTKPGLVTSASDFMVNLFCGKPPLHPANPLILDVSRYGKVTAEFTRTVSFVNDCGTRTSFAALPIFLIATLAFSVKPSFFQRILKGRKLMDLNFYRSRCQHRNMGG